MRKLALALLLVVLASCDREPPNTHAPSMANHSFTPETIEISVGEAVKWVNDTDEAHTVTAVEDPFPAGAEYFSSGGATSEDEANQNLAEELINPGEAFEWTFEEPGTYRYYCIPHKADGMGGIVNVL